MDRKVKKKYFPALGYKYLTRFYDFVMGILVGNKFRTEFISFICVKGEEKILDFGVGTGEIAMRIKKQWPRSQVFGIDIDAAILKIAGKKIKKNDLNEIQLSLYDGQKIPFDENSFDKVILCLVLCNLSFADKKFYLSEIFRVIKPGGEIYACDFGKELSPLKRVMFYFFRSLTPLRVLLREHKSIPSLLSDSGFKNISSGKQIKIITGTLDYFKAIK